MILDWNEVALSIKNNLKKENFASKYVGILLLSSDESSKTYVNLKKKFGNELGLEVHIFSEENKNINPFDKESILEKINKLNSDKNCGWIMVQLPLNSFIVNYTWEILSFIDPQKDIDWLWGITFGLNLVEKINFLPATPKAVFEILDFYKINNLKGKKILVIGQSNIVWKPLVLELMKKEAEVISINKYAEKDFLKKNSLEADYIISAAGVPNLITEEMVRKDFSQVIIDVWFSKVDWKIYGDIDYENVKNLVKAITPVPGGVGPVTVASIFKNMLFLVNNKI